MEKPTQNLLDTSKVLTGLDPLSQIRSKKPPPVQNPKQEKPDKLNFFLSYASPKQQEIEPRIIDFDKIKRNNDSINLNVSKPLLDPSPVQPSAKTNQMPIETPEDPLKNKNLSTGYKDMKTFGFSNDERLPGELVLETTECSIILNSSKFNGKLVLTNFKLHFRPIKTEFYQSYQLRQEYFQMPIMSIDKIGKYPEKKTNYLYLDLQTKDMRVFKFLIPSEFFKEGEKVFSLLDAFLNRRKKEHIAIDFAQNFKSLDTSYKGWEIYDIIKEFDREKADIDTIKKEQENGNKDPAALRFLDNSSGQICNTYPELIVVPSKTSEDLIYKSSKFRTKERIPALTYCYRQIVNGQITRTYLWRSSQCKSGLGSVQRSLEDEDLLRIIGETSDILPPASQEPGSMKYSGILKIFDARPFWNAVGNAVTGKGYENKDNYRNVDVIFLDIHNIHKVRDAYKKLMTACLSHEIGNKWFSALENSGWFQYISTILSGCLQIAEALKKGYQTLVHCSDGWDRTSQVLALTQIMLDPYFRTIDGFIVLIEKDWISFGHQFATRSGHIENAVDSQKSPVFIQFLDCLHQIMTQFPLSFEFNVKFITEIAYHLYSCFFGTLICDSAGERNRNKLEVKTTSLWSFLLANKEKFLNPFYRESQQIDMNELWPNPNIKIIRLWKEHFLAYNIETKDPYQIFPDAFFLEDNLFIEHFRSQEERKLLKMRVSDLNQDVIKLKKILHKYEEKFGKLERKKLAQENNNLNNSVDSNEIIKSPNGEENNESNPSNFKP